MYHHAKNENGTSCTFHCFKFVELAPSPPLIKLHNDNKIIFPQVGIQRPSRSWTLFSPHCAGAGIGTFQTAAGHNPVSSSSSATVGRESQTTD